MNIDAVFSGGGVKGLAYSGVLESIEENQLKIQRVAGTSAGAIIAAFLASNYKVNEIKQLIDKLNLEEFLDPPKITNYIPISKWLFFYFQLGINKGNKLEKWLYEQLAKKNVYTFSDIKDGYLKVVASDLSLGKLVVIPDDLERIYGIEPKYFPVSKAVRMSAGFPYFFMPKKLPGKTDKKSIIVDGGLLSNFPLWIFSNGRTREERPVLGVKFTGALKNQNQTREINNAFDMFTALFATMKEAHDARYISKTDKNNIIFIPVENIDTVNFHITDETKQYLFNLGKKHADQFLKHWPR
ncbi:patatin-like phospholipase family protein [Oceanobacillus senegalensis]|uniref:patatin-like phospholipase family protein n=1 Tax=Oceanobacillus senegalensis TaxID=1936063 RepID=UPI000A3119D4|nr:patatin-like phospholipase family protein [Oceanobacillus senegalensis]